MTLQIQLVTIYSNDIDSWSYPKGVLGEKDPKSRKMWEILYQILRNGLIRKNVNVHVYIDILSNDRRIAN